MRALLQIVVLLALFVTGCSSARKAPISFRSPAGWIEDRGEYYEVSGTTRTGGRLELVRHSPDRRGERAGSMLRWEHLPDQFTGEKCYGRFYISEKESSGNNPVIAIFMMRVDDTLWSGTFRGSMEGWEHALAFLKSAEKNR